MTLPTLDLLRQRLGAAAGEVILSRGVFVLTPERAALVGVVHESPTPITRRPISRRNSDSISFST